MAFKGERLDGKAVQEMSDPNIPGVKKLCFRCHTPWESIESRFDVTWYKCKCGTKLRWEKIHGARGMAPEEELKPKPPAPASIPMEIAQVAPLLHAPLPARPAAGAAAPATARPEDF